MRRAQPRKVKKSGRVSKSAEQLMNQKYLGSKAPVYDGTEASVARALQWHRMINSIDDAKAAGVEFLRTFGMVKAASAFLKIPDKFVPESICWQARLYLDGWEPLKEKVETIKESLGKAIKASIEASSDAPRPMTPARARYLRVSRMVSDLEDVIDSLDTSFSMGAYLKENPITPEYASSVIDYYNPLLEEWVEASTSKTEGYEHISKKEWKDRISLLTSILSELQKLIKHNPTPPKDPSSPVKKTRKPRAKKAVPPFKKVAKLKYLASTSDGSVKSVNPEKVISASEVWLFNDKYKILTRLVAKDSSGFDIKGQSILNFDPTQSSQKRVGRKASEMVNIVLNATKPQLKRILDKVNVTSTEPNGKINNNVLILRVVQ